MTRPPKANRWGMENLVGLIVTMRCQGRLYLGEVKEMWRDDVTSTFRIRVNHFNGEPWPIEPSASSVQVVSQEDRREA